MINFAIVPKAYPRTGSNSSKSKKGSLQRTDSILMKPLVVSRELYDIIEDMFLHDKSFTDLNKSCVELFTDYPPEWEYPQLGLVKDVNEL
jgi:predicted ATP-dependent protease